jgi:hypothetical protein
MQSKHLLAIILLCNIAVDTSAQEPDKSKVYEIRNSIAVIPCDITGKKLYTDGRFSTPPLGSKFMFVRPLNGDTVIIRYLVWTNDKDSALRKYYNDPLIIDKWARVAAQKTDSTTGNLDKTFTDREWNLNNVAANSTSTDTAGQSEINLNLAPSYENKLDKYFLIQRYDLDSNCVKVYNTGLRSTVFTIGLVTMPLKLRLGSNFDFQGNLSLGTTAGVKIRMSKINANYLNLLVGTSISTISLDSFSTRGKISGQPLTNIAVFSPSLGLVFEFGKAQAGIFYGWDVLNKSTQAKYGWIYNKKSWVSIGFGFSIFNVDAKANNAQSNTQ